MLLSLTDLSEAALPLGLCMAPFGFFALKVARLAWTDGRVATAVGAIAFFGLLLFVLVRTLVMRTTVELDGSRLVARRGPFPMRTVLDLPRSAVAQAYVTEHAWFTGGRIGPRRTARRRAAVGFRLSTYRVMVQTRDGRALELAGGIRRKSVALFLEHELERLLGVRDVPLTGTVSRT